MYQVQGRFIEFSDKAMAQLRKDLSVDSTSSAAWVISETDSSSVDAFATAMVKAGSAKVHSRPQMIGIAGQPMGIEIGLEVPISVPNDDESQTTEVKPISISLGVTLSAMTASSDRLDWKFGKTNRNGDWSFVTRNISGASLLQAGEAILIPLPTRIGGTHVIAMLKAIRVVSRKSQALQSSPTNHNVKAPKASTLDRTIRLIYRENHLPTLSAADREKLDVAYRSILPHAELPGGPPSGDDMQVYVISDGQGEITNNLWSTLKGIGVKSQLFTLTVKDGVPSPVNINDLVATCVWAGGKFRIGLHDSEDHLTFTGDVPVGGSLLIVHGSSPTVIQIVPALSPSANDQQFAELANKFNELMRSRRHAEAILIGEKAVELQPDNPAAIIMFEKAKLQKQIEIIQKTKNVAHPNGGKLDSLVAIESLSPHKDGSEPEVVEESPKPEKLPIVKAANSECETFEIESSRTVRCDVGYTVKLRHTSRIKAVTEFDSAVLKVEPTQGDPRCILVHSLAEGGAQIRIVDENNAEYLVNVLSLEFSGLDVYLKHLFPAVKIEVWPIKGSVLLRGNVTSELQKEHFVAVAEQFYPSILDQLTVEPNPASSSMGTNRHVPISDDLATKSAITILAGNSSLILPRNNTRTLAFPETIRSVGDFNNKLIKAEPVQGSANSISVQALANGATKLTVVDKNDKSYFVDIVIEDSVQELSLLAGRLYPDLDLKFFSVKGAILVRGAVQSEAQCQQILDVAHQFAHNVLNQTHVVTNAAAATRTVSLSKNRQANLDANGVQAIRSDIKALHVEVRDLIEILKARKAVDAAK